MSDKPGIKLHPRHDITYRAELEFGQWVLAWEKLHGLTPGEVIGILGAAITGEAKYLRRMERHGDATKKGDEA